MDEKMLQALYGELQGRLDLGDFNSFKTQLSNDPKFRFAVFNEASGFLELGSQQDFENYFASAKKKDAAAGSSFPTDPSSSGSATASASASAVGTSRPLAVANPFASLYQPRPLDNYSVQVNNTKAGAAFRVQEKTGRDMKGIQGIVEGRQEELLPSAAQKKKETGDGYNANRLSFLETALPDAGKRTAFTRKFYDGAVSAADMEAIRQANPVAFDQLYGDVSNEELANRVNAKTANLREYAKAPKLLQARGYLDERERLKHSVEFDLPMRINNVSMAEGRNSIYKGEDGKYHAVIPGEKFMEDLARDANTDLASLLKQQKEKLAYLENTFRTRVAEPEMEKVNQKFIAQQEAAAGKPIQQVYREAKANGGMFGGVRILDANGHLSEDGVEYFNRRYRDFLTKENNPIIYGMEHGKARKEAGLAHLATAVSAPLALAVGNNPVADLWNNIGDKETYSSPEVAKKFRTYFNYVVPQQIAMEDEKQRIASEDPLFSRYLKADQTLSQFFSADATKANEAYLKSSLDASYVEINNRTGKILQGNPAFLAIQDKWQQRVKAGEVTPEIAARNIETEARANETLRGVLQSRDGQINASRNKVNGLRQQYIVNGVKAMGANMQVVDGKLVMNGVNLTDYQARMQAYEKRILDAGEKAVDAQAAAVGTKADAENLARVKRWGGTFRGGLAGGMKSTFDNMGASLSEWMLHKTGIGADAYDYFDAQETANPVNVGAYAEQHYRFKGLRSLVDPAYLGFTTGQSIPYVVPAVVVGAATGGSGLGAAASATLEAFTNAATTYRDLYQNGVNVNGTKMTSEEASDAATAQFKTEVLPNIILQNLEFGTLLRSGKSFARPVLNAATVAKGVGQVAVAGATEGVQEAVQGYIQQTATQRAKGERADDIYDYLQTDDFRQNLVGGIMGGIVMGGALKPKGYMDKVKVYNQMSRQGTAEFQREVPYAYSIAAEMNGTASQHRDALRLRLLNEDYADDAEKQSLQKTLVYAERLADNIKRAGVASSNINGIYAAHNAALADLYEQAASVDEGRSTLSKNYAAQAKAFRDASGAALSGQAQAYYVEDKDGHPIFLSENGAKTLLENGTMGRWYEDGAITNARSLHDEEFNNQAVTDFAGRTFGSAKTTQAEDAPAVDPVQEGISLLRENRATLPPQYRDFIDQNPEIALKEIADQALGRLSTGADEATLGAARQAAEATFGKAVVDAAVRAYPSVQQDEETLPAADEIPSLNPADLTEGAALTLVGDTETATVIGNTGNSVEVRYDRDGTTQSLTYEEFNDWFEATPAPDAAPNSNNLAAEEPAPVADGAASQEGMEMQPDVQPASVADRIRALADKLEQNTSGGAFALPVPITPKMIATGLRGIATAVEAGAQVIDAIREAVAQIKLGLNGQAIDEKKLVDYLLRQTELIAETGKPQITEGEAMPEYAKRVVAWRREMMAKLTGEQRKAAKAVSAVEASYVRMLTEGTRMLKENSSIGLAAFNEALNLPAEDTETYVASIYEHLKNGSLPKPTATGILRMLRETNPKRIMLTEVAVLRLQYRAEQAGASTGYRAAQKEAAKALDEYRAAQREAARNAQNAAVKKKVQETKDRYEQKLDRLKLTQKLIDQHNAWIRSQVQDILSAANQLGLFNGVKYTGRELLSFGAAVNRVVSEKSLMDFGTAFNRLIGEADYVRQVQTAKTNLDKLRALKKRTSILPVNDVSMIKAFTALNPLRVKNLTRYNEIADDILNSRTAQPPIANITNATVYQFIEEQQQGHLERTAETLLNDWAAFLQSPLFGFASSNNLVQNMPDETTMQNLLAAVVVAPSAGRTTSYQEAMKELDRYREAVDTVFNETVVAQGYVKSGFGLTPSPVNWTDVIAAALSPGAASSTSAGANRLTLESAARAVQHAILPGDPSLTAEQNAALAVLKGLDVTDMSATDLRLFMNVVNNVAVNDDYSGMGEFETLQKSRDEGWGALNAWLQQTGFQVRARPLPSKLRKGLRDIKNDFSSTENIYWHVANNSRQLATKLFQVTRMAAIKEGFVKATRELKERVYDPLNRLIKEDGLVQDANTNIRLTLYSWLRQNQQGTQLENEAEFQRRLSEIKRDINVKEQFGTEEDKQEAALIAAAFEELRTQVLSATGKDINTDDVAGVDGAVLDVVPFLSTEQAEAYDLFRDFYDRERPAFEDVMTRQLNQNFKGWFGYMPDSFRKLHGGVINIDISPENFGSSVLSLSSNAFNAQASALNQRSAGMRIQNPASSGEDTHVINYNWFANNIRNADEMLFDIHTLSERQTASRVFTSKEFQNSVGLENSKLLKEQMVKELQNMTGLGGTSSTSLALIRSTVSAMTKMAAKIQLISISAFLKQSASAMVNSAVVLGPQNAINIAKGAFLAERNTGAKALLNQFEISLRGERKGGTNIFNEKNVSDVDQRVSESDLSDKYRSAVNWLNGRNSLTGEEKSRMRWFIEKGDVLAAQASWLAFYGTHLVQNGRYYSFSDIDWNKEAVQPNREAASYAQLITSKQLNVNSNNSLSKIYSDKNSAVAMLKAIFGLFSSFGFNKSVANINNMHTLFSRGNIVDAAGNSVAIDPEQLRDEKTTAWKHLAAGLAEEVVFNAIKSYVVKLTIVAPLMGLFKNFADDEEDKQIDKYLAGLYKSSALFMEDEDGKVKYNPDAANALLFQTFSNYFFSVAGSGQQGLNKVSNNLLDMMGAPKDYRFFVPGSNPNQHKEEGVMGAAFGDMWKDIARLKRMDWDRTDRSGKPVDPPSGEEYWLANIALLSNMASAIGWGDADVNRAIHKRLEFVDKAMGQRYGDPYYVDLNAMRGQPRNLTLGVRKVAPNEEQWNYYTAERDSYKRELDEKQRNWSEAKRRSVATERAKQLLFKKFGATLQAAPPEDK